MSLAVRTTRVALGLALAWALFAGAGVLPNRWSAAMHHQARIQRTTLAERERGALSGPESTPAGEDLASVQAAADLFKPLLGALPPLGLPFALVQRSERVGRERETHDTADDLATAGGAQILLHELAPIGHITFAPYARFERWLAASTKDAFSPEALTILQGTEIYLFHGFSELEIQAVQGRLAELFGFDILVAGRRTARSHILLLAPLAERIRSGEAKALSPLLQ